MKNAAGRITGLILIAALLPACGVGSGAGTLTPTIAPGIPTDVEVLAGSKSITISWTASAAGASYTILRALNAHGPFFPVSVPANFRRATTYVDDGLINGTDYYYAVQADNPFGSSPPSRVQQGTPSFKPRSVAAGPYSAMLIAVLPDGSVWEWGGLTNLTQTATPTQRKEVQDITAVAAGTQHALALDRSGTIWAWGLNSTGQLGNGSTSFSVSPPAPITSLSGMTAIAAGKDHSLALSHDGTVWGWGDNSSAQLGTGSQSSTPVSIPIQISGLADIIAIACGVHHSLALRKDGLVFAWGQNAFCESGIPQSQGYSVPSPRQIDNMTNVIGLAAGDTHSLVLRGDGTVWGWGLGGAGILGTGSTSGTGSPVPVQIGGLTGITAIASSYGHSLAVKNDGTVWAWGADTRGQLGDGNSDFNSHPVPAKIGSLKGIRDVAAGITHSVALGTEGSVWSWGNNTSGELGNSTGTVQVVPVQLPNLNGVVSVSAAVDWSVIAPATGSILVTGADDWRQLGTSTYGTFWDTPITNGVTDAKSVGGGYLFGVALHANGTLQS